MSIFDGTAAGIENIKQVWNMLANLIKKLIGDVDLTKGDLQTQINNNNKNFVKSGNGAKAGLVPAPPTTAGTSKYLREDGTWQTPPDTNTTYSNASLGQGYGTCSTAAATAAKVVSLSSYSLTPGGVVSVKFTYAVPASATMNINSKGAKAIYYKGAAITAGIINAGDVATFMYNGSQYILLTVDSYQTKINALDKAINDALALRASLGAYGLVKVTDSSAVTDSTGLALAATEKNASIEGTMANQISQLNTDSKSSDYNAYSFNDNGYFECQILVSKKIGNIVITSMTIHCTQNVNEWNEIELATRNLEKIYSYGGLIQSQNTGKCYFLTGGIASTSINIRSDASGIQKDDWLRGLVVSYIE